MSLQQQSTGKYPVQACVRTGVMTAACHDPSSVVRPCQRLLASSFDSLPPAIQAFHQSGDGTMRGIATVERGGGRLCAIMARLAGLPPSGQDMPVTVTVQRQGNAERWIRCFGAHRMASVLTDADGLLQ